MMSWRADSVAYLRRWLASFESLPEQAADIRTLLSNSSEAMSCDKELATDVPHGIMSGPV